MSQVGRLSLTSLITVSNIFYMFEPTWLQIINNLGSHLFLTGFSLMLVSYYFSFILRFVLLRVRWKKKKISFAGNWCKCRAHIYKFYMYGHFRFCNLIDVHRLSDLCIWACSDQSWRPRSHKFIIIRSTT